MNLLPEYPLSYQLNTRVLITDLSEQLGRAATLDDIPDSELDRLADRNNPVRGCLSFLVLQDVGDLIFDCGVNELNV
jgi:hypothetical protein